MRVQQGPIVQEGKGRKGRKAPRRRLGSARSVKDKGTVGKRRRGRSADASTKKVPRQIGLAWRRSKMPASLYCSLLILLAWRHRKQQIRWVRRGLAAPISGTQITAWAAVIRLVGGPSTDFLAATVAQRFSAGQLQLSLRPSVLPSPASILDLCIAA